MEVVSFLIYRWQSTKARKKKTNQLLTHSPIFYSQRVHFYPIFANITHSKRHFSSKSVFIQILFIALHTDCNW